MPRHAHILVAFALALGACTSDAPTGPVGGGGNTPPGDMAGAPPDLSSAASKNATTITVDVPASFKGTPRALLVAAFDSFPVTGPPAAVLYQGMPTIMAGMPVQVTGDATGLAGTKQVLAVLYVQGGGMLSPKPGVDYASGPQQVTFDGKPVTIGPLQLMLVPGSDGGL
jgi:hypothetical protein